VRSPLPLLLAWSALLLALPAAAETRLALIIGNSNYQNPRLHLANPGNDAMAMKTALEKAGFETIVALDARRVDFYHAVDKFGSRLGRDREAVGLFYYAGHGVQADGINYLIPVDAELDTDADLEANAFDVSRVLRAMRLAQNEMNIVILDACRDNPLPHTRGMGRGLARMDAPDGMFIAYAAAPGQSALDGVGGANGVFTGELVKAMAEPGVPLERMFKNVIAGVSSGTRGKQRPWSEESIQGDFYFHPPVGAAAALPVASDARAADMQSWGAIRDSKSPDDFRTFLAKYPQSDFAPAARLRLKSLQSVQTSAKAAVPPHTLAAAPAAAAPAVNTQNTRCAALAERIQVGDTLNEEERTYLRDKCH